jgi:DNA-binding transcriptional MocR family regulator
MGLKGFDSSESQLLFDLQIRERVPTMNSLVPEIMNALKKEERVRTLQMLAEGYTLSEIQNEIDMSFAGVQNYYDAFEETNLVQEVDGEKQITPAGEMVLEWLTDLSDELESIQREMARTRYERMKKQLGQGFQLPPFEDVYQEGELQIEEK